MSSDGTHSSPPDTQSTLDAWRACGADRLDPVRFRFLDAMARRTAMLGGPARQLLDAKLAALLQAYESQVAAAAADASASDAAPTALSLIHI